MGSLTIGVHCPSGQTCLSVDEGEIQSVSAPVGDRSIIVHQGPVKAVCSVGWMLLGDAYG